MKNSMKSSQLNKIKNSVLIASLGAFLFSSCTKQIPYKTAEVPPEVQSKTYSTNLFKSNEDYLYSASQQNASRSATDARPFSAGDNKRVRIEMTEKSLRIIEKEKDERFASNSTNDKLVLEIPVEHVELRCAKDRFGECTNTEEEAKDIAWDQKSLVRINYGEVKSGEIDILPVISDPACYIPVSSKLVRSDIEQDAINFQVERTFKVNLDMCDPGDISELSEATISAVYHYSLVKTKSVLSKDFKTVSYPDGSSDEQTFGFFTSKRNQLDVDNNLTDKSTIQIMNRWNPNRSVIDYHLSDEFAKPENKLIKDLTFQTVDNLNKGLAESGVKFRINLHEPSGKIPGDIRNSMIVLVEDPVASSVIGYGPQTEDPVTGEIISARTIMFLGTIKKFVKYTYDEIIREKRAAKTSTLKLSAKLTQATQAMKSTGQMFGATEMNKAVANFITQVASVDNSAAAPSANKNITTSATQLVADSNKLLKIEKEIKNYTSRKNNRYDSNDRKTKLLYMNEVKNCSFNAVDGAAGGISEKLMSQFADDAKSWEELSADEKEKAIAIILPEIWVPTLIHEMGHNLGLRHNFSASEDKANFYSKDDLAKIGSDHVIPFSSVMDYGNDLKTLPVLGKYDIAALKFGYLRQVDAVTADGKSQTVDVKDTLENLESTLAKNGLQLKDYKYCTDEHLGINAGCKQFDLGTSYTEIAQNMIKDYEEAYTKRNLRSGRANMSLMDDLTYASRIRSIFQELRIMMETMERIKYRYGLASDAQEWTTIPFLKDLKQATLLSGSFLANVLLVPDVTCAVAKTENLNEVIAIVPLSNFGDDLMNCYDAKLKSGFSMVAQAGKKFNSMKDPESRNSYADQIDVRGIWIDKVLAARALTNRQVNITLSMDEHTDNFLNIPELRKGILETLQAIMSNNVINTVAFTTRDGVQVPLEIQYDLADSQVIAKPFLIDRLERIGASEESRIKMATRLGVNLTGKTALQQTMARQFAWASVDPNKEHNEDNAITASLSVTRTASVMKDKIVNSARSVTIDNVTYIADAANTLARSSIENMAMAKVLEQVEPSVVEKLLTAKLAKQQLPPKSTEAEKAIWKLKPEVMDAYLNGILKSSSYYENLLKILPST